MPGLNLLVFNLAMDAGHSALGHSVTWVNELAQRADHVSVITMEAGTGSVAPNVTVHSLGKELGRSEPRRLAEFYRLTNRVLDEQPVDACFAHMAPLFTVMFAPIARRRGIPILLWYAHPSVTNRLRAAHAVADRCVTSTPAAFRLPSEKLYAVGQGIDMATFVPPSERPPDYERTLLAIGRLSPVKRVEDMLEALSVLEYQQPRGLRLRLVGGAQTESDKGYIARLRRLSGELGIEDLVTFAGAVPFSGVPAEYHRGGLYLNFFQGSFDKAIIEAMASGSIPVSTNPPFAELARKRGFEALVPSGGIEGIAQTIATVVDARHELRESLRGHLRTVVGEEHALGRLMDRIVLHLADLVEQRGSRKRDGNPPVLRTG